MEASKPNRIVESQEPLKFVEISGPILQELAQKLKVALPEKWQASGAIFIGPETKLHYQTIAKDLGLDPEDLSEEQKEIFITAKYTNAGHLVNIGGKSRLVGTSMTLSNEEGIRFAALEGTKEKHDLDEATRKRLNEIYAGTWVFEIQ